MPIGNSPRSRTAGSGNAQGASRSSVPPQGAEPDEPEDAARSLRAQLVSGVAVLLGVSLITITGVVGLWVRFIGTSPELLVFLALTLLADVAVIFLFANQVLDREVLDPVESMVQGAERVGEGDHEYRLEPSGARELQRLALTVNRMADHLIQQQTELAHTVASLHETNRELRQAQRELVRAEKLASAGRLAAGIAHEIGNPLGSIIGYAEVLKRRHPDAEEWAEDIEGEARRIDRIVESLIKYARPDEDDDEHHPVELSVSVKDSLDLLRAQGRLEEIQIEVELPENLPRVRIGPAELEQVLVNLLLNALDAIEEGGAEQGRISIAAATKTSLTEKPLGFRGKEEAPRRASDPEGLDLRHLREDPMPDPEETEPVIDDAPDVWVKLTVADNGPGFPGDNPEKVLDPFFTTKEPGKGTGLGLFVSSQILRRWGGWLDVENQTDGGGAVSLWLPAQDEERQDGEETR